MSLATLEIGHDAGTWTWEDGNHTVEATDASMPAGEVRAVLTVRQDGSLAYRSGVKLTSDRERSRFLQKVEEAGCKLPSGILLAMEEQIRQDGVPLRDESSNGAGSRIALEDPEPWPVRVDGAELLDDLVGAFERFLGLPDKAAEALALWTLHAHAHDASDVSPLLALTSPEKRCGKTTALHVLGALAPRPLPASNVTAAALFRAVEKFGPTLLVDEADTFLRDREDLRGILNSGHHRASAYVIRTSGDDHEPSVFSTWAPKAVAMIGKLPDTLADRSIIIPMRRRQSNEVIERLRIDKLTELEPLRRKAWRWARDHEEELHHSDPDVELPQAAPDAPKQLHDRAADNWRPLFAIADAAGGEWPARARQAALALVGVSEDDDGSVRALLLHDLQTLFDKPITDRLSSQAIVLALERLEDRPWPEWGRSQKPLSKRGLAKLLRPFGVRPKTIKLLDGSTAKGYVREDLKESWSRYLPQDGGAPNVTPSPSSNDAGNSGFHKRNQGGGLRLCNHPKTLVKQRRLRWLRIGRGTLRR
jgi:putative DNA primase/helicase